MTFWQAVITQVIPRAYLEVVSGVKVL
jgi:hypothetical protein